ncbi:hypothetical protein Y1Q_0013611 [Alligator mississippiensis]|uniref:Uncharacterized protein n=1 Tax=Alligator mississippiensis TaxID=8496 RepID=A0A151P3E1_ALLMI|nr:hypothetical protein Y1Q_0013611 [Alligator mississippiensis]
MTGSPFGQSAEEQDLIPQREKKRISGELEGEDHEGGFVAVFFLVNCILIDFYTGKRESEKSICLLLPPSSLGKGREYLHHQLIQG